MDPPDGKVKAVAAATCDRSYVTAELPVLVMEKESDLTGLAVSLKLRLETDSSVVALAASQAWMRPAPCWATGARRLVVVLPSLNRFGFAVAASTFSISAGSNVLRACAMSATTAAASGVAMDVPDSTA